MKYYTLKNALKMLTIFFPISRANFLAALVVLVQLINAILIIRIFGISKNADALFLSTMIISSLTLLSQLFLEQFWVYYAETKSRQKDDLNKLVSTVITIGMLLQTFLCIIVFDTSEDIIQLYAKNFQTEQKIVLTELLNIHLIGFLFFPISVISSTVLNAERKLSLSYGIQLIQPLAITLTLYLMLQNDYQSIYSLVIVTSISSVISALTAFINMKRLGINIHFSLFHPRLVSLLMNSFTMRAGQNINNFFQQPIITNRITSLESGYASIFTYAKRFADILYAIIAGPSSLLLRACINEAIPVKNSIMIHESIKKFFRVFFVMIPAGITTFLVLEYILILIAGENFSIIQISEIKTVFIILYAWILLLTLDYPFSVFLISSKNSKLMIIESLLYIFLLGLFSRILLPILGINSLPLSLIISQLMNNLVNFTYYSYSIRNWKISTKQCTG